MVTIEIKDGEAVSSIDVDGLSEEELRAILFEMKSVNEKIGEIIVEIVQNKDYLTFEQTKVITDEVKKGNIDKAIKSHQFFLDSEFEVAKKFVDKVIENIDLYEAPKEQ